MKQLPAKTAYSMTHLHAEEAYKALRKKGIAAASKKVLARLHISTCQQVLPAIDTANFAGAGRLSGMTCLERVLHAGISACCRRAHRHCSN